MRNVTIVVDQPSESGIGVYARRLYRLLSPALKGLQLLDLGYFGSSNDFPSSPSWLIKTRVPIAVPIVVVRNEHAARKIISRARGLHLCGAHYGLSDWSTAVVATVHDYYVRKLTLDTLKTPAALAREAYTLLSYVLLPQRLERCAGVISVSEWTRNSLSNHTGIQSQTIHHWVDPNLFFPRNQGRAREALGLPRDKGILLNVGRGTMNKGEKWLASVAANLSRDWVVVKVGHRLESHSENLVNLGVLSDELYPLVFAAADVYFHSSVAEGFGIPLIEALASGTPVLARDSPTAREVLREAGVLLRGDQLNDFGLIGATLDDLRSDPEARESARAEAARFSPEIAREAYLQAYSKWF